MKKRINKVHFLATMGMAVLLIAAGVLLTIRMFDIYGNLILENTDNQLISLARSVDRSAKNRLERYTENLLHMINHEELEEAEKHWREEGDADALIAFFEKSVLGQDEEVAAILLLEQEEVVLSTDGETEYRFAYQVKEDTDISLALCMDESDHVFLALVSDGIDDSKYAVLLDAADFYEEITQNLSNELQNEIVMMDTGEQTLIHRQDGNVKVDWVDAFSEKNSKFCMLSFLLKQHETGEEGTDFCDAVSGATSKAYRARMAVVPATEETNGFFTVGVSTDYDQMTKPMREGAVRLMIYGAIVVVGIVGLLILLLHTFRGNQRALKELDILREKNAAMEELNRKTQELAHHQRLELMGTLTSGIAHEFNNLLAPIMGYSILILEKIPQEETELYDEVLEIYNTSRKAKTVISRLSDLSGKNASTDFHPVSLDELVKKAVELTRPAKPKTVAVELSLNCREQKIYGNETQLSQMLLNLIINGFHATEETGGTLTITTLLKEETISLRISDDGYGIPKEALERIFEPFFTTKKGGKGTGLGLAIVHQVVEDHTGTIQVESTEGHGTTFTIEFPLFFNKS